MPDSTQTTDRPPVQCDQCGALPGEGRFCPKCAPGHTDLMVSPEDLDAWLEKEGYPDAE
jgi:hypothetical protein